MILFSNSYNHRDGELVGFLTHECGDNVERIRTMRCVFKLFETPISLDLDMQTLVELSLCEA